MFHGMIAAGGSLVRSLARLPLFRRTTGTKTKKWWRDAPLCSEDGLVVIDTSSFIMHVQRRAGHFNPAQPYPPDQDMYRVLKRNAAQKREGN